MITAAPQYTTEDPSHYQAPMYVYSGTNRTFALVRRSEAQAGFVTQYCRPT
jgi:hypothetical protein